MIKSLVDKFGGKNASLPDLRFLLTCLLGFSGFLRIEGLLSIKIKHLRINESHLEILVPKSKTDQHREGHIVYISRISSECCPVKFLEKYLQRTNIEISKDGEIPLIARIFKTRKGHKISKTQRISYSRIREVFQDYITDITTNPEKYGLHSLRAGGASAAASNGVTDRLFSGRFINAVHLAHAPIIAEQNDMQCALYPLSVSAAPSTDRQTLIFFLFIKKRKKT